MTLIARRDHVKVIEMTGGWSILWPTGRITRAPSAAIANRRIKRHIARLARQEGIAINITQITWVTADATGTRVVKAVI